MKKPAALLLSFTMLVSYASIGPIEGAVRLGQTAFVGGPKVRPYRIIEDSRCPANLQCVGDHAGRL